MTMTKKLGCRRVSPTVMEPNEPQSIRAHSPEAKDNFRLNLVNFVDKYRLLHGKPLPQAV